jgi:hypothetical protein
VAIENATGHDPVVVGNNFDLRFFRCGVDKHPSEPAGGGATGELKPVHRPVAGTDVPCPVHLTLPYSRHWVDRPAGSARAGAGGALVSGSVIVPTGAAPQVTTVTRLRSGVTAAAGSKSGNTGGARLPALSSTHTSRNVAAGRDVVTDACSQALGIAVVFGDPSHHRPTKVNGCRSSLTSTRCDPRRRVSTQPSRLSAARTRAALGMW